MHRSWRKTGSAYGSDYRLQWSGKIQYLAAQEGIDTLDSQYTDKVVFIFLVPGEQEESFKAKLVESTNGRAVIRTDGEVYYGKCGGELILL